MSEFSWDELPAEVTVSKKDKRDTLKAEEIPAAIQKMAQVATTSGKFHYQPLPHKDLADDFMKFIRAAGDFTTPEPTTVLAKSFAAGTEYPGGANGKMVKVTRGVVVRYSAGKRRGRNADETETAGEGSADSE